MLQAEEPPSMKPWTLLVPSLGHGQPKLSLLGQGQGGVVTTVPLLGHLQRKCGQASEMRENLSESLTSNAHSVDPHLQKLDCRAVLP